MAISSSIIKSFQLTALSTALALAGCGGGGGNDTLMPKIPKASMTSVTNDSASNDSNTAKNLANVKKVQLVSAQSVFSLTDDRQLELTVYALDANNLGVAGVPVNIAITDPNFTGVYSSTVQNLTTDEAGKATITLEVGALSNDQRDYLKNTGLEVRATVGELTTNKLLKGTDGATNTTPNNTNVKDILLISDQQNIALEKGSKLELTAIALDNDNNFIPNTAVNFNISNSVLTGVFANSNLTVTTNEKGEAKLELEVKSLTSEQAQYLKENGLVITSSAQSNGVKSNTIVLKGIEASTNEPVQKLDVQAINMLSSVNPFTVQTGEKFTVTAVVLNSSNTGLGGVPVRFELLDNPADTGVYVVSDTANVVTNAQGQATIELEVKSDSALQRLMSQGVRVRAMAQNTMGVTPIAKTQTLTVMGKQAIKNPEPINTASVLLSSNVTEFDLTVGNKFTVTANVADKDRGAIANVPVTFSLPNLDQTGVANLSGSTIATDAKGQASIELELKSLNDAQRNYLLTNGLVINANVPNGTSVKPLVIKAKQVDAPKTVSSVSVTSDSTGILMAKGTKIKVTAIALDDNFGGIANQTLRVNLPEPMTTGVYNITGSTLTTNDKGEATIELEVKSDLTNAQKDALRNGLAITVTSANGKTGALRLKGQTANPETADRVTLTASITRIPLTVGEQFTVTANVADANNGSISNAPVVFNLPPLAEYGIASLSPATVTTNEQGQAVITLQVQSLTDEQRANLLKGFAINATANGKQAPTLTLQGVDNTTQRFDVQRVRLTSPANAFNVKVGERFTVTASVLNGNNIGIGGVPVSFNLVDDPVITGVYVVSDASNVTTNANGEATVELEVKSEAAKAYLLQNGARLTATAKNTAATPTRDVTGSIAVRAADPAAAATNPNIAKVASALLSSSINQLDLTTGTKFSVTANIADANRGALRDVPVTFSIPGLEQTGIANLTGSTVITNEQGQATIELEIKSLNQAQRDYLLNNGFVVNASVPNGTRVNPITISTNPPAIEQNVNSVSVTADSNTILMAAGSRVKVTAIALDSNFGGMANQALTFNITDPALTGVFNTTGSTINTNARGEAIIELEVKSALSAEQKRALAEGVTVEVVSTNGKTGSIVITGQPVSETVVGNIALTSNVTNIPLTVGSQFTITATALDPQNGALANIPVTFNLPSFDDYGVASLSPSTVTTNEQGQAVITLQVQSLTDEQRANLLKGFAINATANGKQAPTLTLQGVDNTTQRFDVRRVILNKAFDKYTIKVGEKFTITASVLNPSNEPIAGVPVSFSVPNPSNTGLYAVSNISNVTTNARGEATIELEVKSEAHKQALINGVNFYATAKNTASATPSDVRSTALTVQGVDPSQTTTEPNVAKVDNVLLSSSLTEFDLTTGTKFKVTANVGDGAGGALARVPVSFSIPRLEQTGIANLTGSTVITNEQGQATIELEIKSLNQAQRDYLLNNGFVVNASVPNGTRVNPITISTNPPAIEQNVNSVSVTADSNTILMAAGSRVKVTAIALDSNFGGMANQALTFNITDPALTGVFNTTGSTINTNARGEAIIELEVKSALSAEQKRALAEGVTVEVVSTNGKTGSIVITGQPVSETVVGNVALTSNVTNIPLTVGSQFTITATALDPQNGALANIPVTFNLPSFDDYGVASLSPSTVTTNEQGQAVITLQVQSLTDEQRANLLKGFAINATANGKQAPTLTLQGVDNTTQRFDVRRVILNKAFDKYTIKVGEKFTITASVLNPSNEPIAGVPVSFSVPNPSNTGLYAVSNISNVTTNARGEATIELEVKSEAHKQALINGVNFYATAKNTASATPSDVRSTALTVQGVDPTPVAQQPNSAKVASALLSSSINQLDLTTGTKFSVTANIADANRGALRDVPVTFSIPGLEQTGIANLTGSTVITNEQGQATIELEIKSLNQAQRDYLLNNGFVVNASVPNGTRVNPITISTNPPAIEQNVNSVSVTADSNTILMAAGSRVKVTAIALDSNFGGMANQALTFNITDPALTGVFNTTGSTINTNARGEAIIELEVKSALSAEQKRALAEGVTVEVVSTNGKTGSIVITGQPVSETVVGNIALTSNVTNIPLTVGSQFTITATALDPQNGALANIPVTFNLPSFDDYGVASLSPSTVTTNEQGQAVITLQVQSLTDEQRANLLKGFAINATANGKQAPTLTLQGVDNTTQRFDVQRVRLTSPANAFNVKVGERFTVTASVLNGNNIGIGGVPVSFNLVDDPAITGVYVVSDASNVTTNANGEATVELEVKSEAAKAYLLQNGARLTATAKNTAANPTRDVTGSIAVRATDPAAAATNPNIAKVTSGVLSSNVAEFDMLPGSKITATASVADANGGALSGVPVTFSLPSLDQTGFVNLTGSTVTTNSEGQATITVELKKLDAAQRTYLQQNGLKIAANVPNGTAIAPITLGVKDTVVAKEVQNVTVTADSNTILMVAGSKVTVTAVALDDNFGGMKDVDLSFNIPNPQLTGVFNITGSTVGTGSTVRTDERGEAKIELEIKSQLTEAQKQQLQNGLPITVTAPNGKQGIFTLKGQGANETKVNALTLVSDISRIPLTIGSEFTVTALVVDANNGQVTDGVPVTFNLPSLAESGLISLSPSTVRTQNGQASIKLRVQSLTEAQRTALQNGITINATANGQQTALTLQAQPQPSVTVNSVALITDTNTISTDGNETINVTAILRDTANNALGNVPVSFVIDDTNATGIFAASPQNNVLTNANGEATLQLQSRALTDEQRIYLQTMGLTVRVNAGDKTAQTTLRAPMTDASNQAATLMLRSEFNNIAMNVGNKVKLTAVVLDQNSAIVPNASVSFNVPTDSGLINNTGAVVKTGADGRATIELEVTQVTEMLRNGVTITAQSGNARMTTVLRGATNNSSTQAYELFVTQSKERLNTASDTMTLAVRVLDTQGGVQANVPVFLQLLDDGVRQGLSFDANSALRTNENGYVEFDLRQSDVGLVAKLDHTAHVRVMVNDGVFRTEEQTLEIPVTGTAVRNVLASKTSVTDNETISVSGQLVDGGGRAITNTRVTLLNNNQPLATPVAANTDNAGNFRVSVNTAALGAAANGTYPLSVRVEGTDRNNQRISQDFPLVILTQVDPNRLSLSLQRNGTDIANNELSVGNSGDVVVNLPSDIPVGSVVYLSTDRGVFGNGQSRLGVTVPESRQVTFGGLRSDAPGTARLTLTHNDNTLLNSTVSFISNDVQKLLLQVTNSTVSVNGETNVIATVRDSNDAPIKNALVEFSIVADPSSGRLSSATALTNDSGVAQIAYFAGGVPTPVNGVEIRAAVNQVRIGNEYTNVTRPQVASQRLTVQSMATYIGFAFSDTLQVSADNIYYLQDGSIFVNNSVGQPAANQEVSIAVVPETYTLGLWRVIPRVPEVPEVRDDNGNVTTPAVPEQPARWGQSYFDNTSGRSTQMTGSASCLNEDLNRNGILDAGEDYNGDGQLTPINPITVLGRDGQQLGSNQVVRTDSAGKLDFTIRYPKEYAQWMTATVWVTTRVDGSEFRGQRTISLPLVQDDVTLDQTNSTGTRPNTISPFGTLVTANMASFCRPSN